jgi:lipoprotein-releasing system ATP-binding protein
MIEAVLRARNIKKDYPQGSSTLEILKGVSLEVHAAESISVVGASGSGKSTLLHILGTLDRPTSGELVIRGQDVLSMSDEDLSLYRNHQMGFVFQFHHLLAEFTALENVALPLRIGGMSKEQATVKAQVWLRRVGLAARETHFPSQLSGGELQRIAIARALVGEPKILMADEPTGNLDSRNSLIIQELFFELKAELNLTLLVVTHDAQFAGKFNRSLRLSDGQWI